MERLPRLARLSLARCRSDQVLDQLPALAPLACTLTFLDLSEAHRWDGRMRLSNDGVALSDLAALTRLRALVLSSELRPGITDAGPAAGHTTLLITRTGQGLLVMY